MVRWAVVVTLVDSCKVHIVLTCDKMGAQPVVDVEVLVAAEPVVVPCEVSLYSLGVRKPNAVPYDVGTPEEVTMRPSPNAPDIMDKVGMRPIITLLTSSITRAPSVSP